MKITSVNNDLVKETAKLQQRKYRDESGLFLLEGDKCIEEAIESGIEIENLFILEGYEAFEGIEKIETTEAVLSKISTTTSAPRAVAAARQKKQEWLSKYKKVLLLEDIKDAGNLGTILRTSAAFGVDAVILYGDTVDLYNPKCVRSSVGNLWKVPVFEIKDIDLLKNTFSDYERVATLPKSENSVWLNDYKAQEKVLLMFGCEAKGLSEYLKNFATKNVTIEMSDKVESLNLSISVGVMLYKLMR
jgi:TrmH family RNA methyltransferase